jgi:hypothetical protein
LLILSSDSCFSALFFFTKFRLWAGAWLVVTPSRAHGCKTHSFLTCLSQQGQWVETIDSEKEEKRKVENKKKLLKLLKKKLYFTVFI